MDSTDRIIELIENNEKFLIASHENPDCDALGSTIAMSMVLREMGKHVVMYNTDGVPGYLQFLPDSSLVMNSLCGEEEKDVILVLDCADIERPGGEFAKFASRSATAVAFIDHHATNGTDCEYRIVDENASSTGVLLYRMLKRMGISISSGVAECLFSTIVGDTGSFRHSNTCTETFEIAADLVNCGADPEKVARFIYDNQPLEKIRLRNLVMNTLEVEGKIAFLYVSENMLRETGTNVEHTEGLAGVGRSIQGVEVSVFCRQESETKWKVSLRSKEYLDVSCIAALYGGGGHRKAAGCRISAPLGTVKSMLFGSIRESL